MSAALFLALILSTFAAIVFYPLHLIPFWILTFAWQVAIIAALYGVVRISQRLLPGECSGPRSGAIACRWA